MSIATPEKIQKLQRKLCLKAKRESTYRFYALYDKVLIIATSSCLYFPCGIHELRKYLQNRDKIEH